MTDADEILIEALLDDILDPTMIRDAVDEAVRLLEGKGQNDRSMASRPNSRWSTRNGRGL